MRSNRKIFYLLYLYIILNLKLLFADANYQNVITNGLNVSKVRNS